MKHFLLAIILIISAAKGGSAQNVWPNGSFERWHSVGGLYDSLDEWTSNNSPSFTGIRRDSVKKADSAYSLQVLQHGWARSRPSRSFMLGLYFRQMANISVGDSVTIRVVAIKAGAAFFDSTDRHLLNSIPNWSYNGYHLSFNNYPDSLQVVIIGGHDSATTFNIDNAFFHAEGVENIAGQIKPILAPNPMLQQAVLRFESPQQIPYRFVLTDATGRTIKEQDGVREEQILIERKSLPPGLYIWQLWSESSGGRAAGSLTIE